MNALNAIEKVKIDQSEVKDITNLYEHKGKDFYYKETLKKEIPGITNHIVSTTVRIIMDKRGIEVSDSRLRLLITKDSPAKNKDEHMVKNIASIIKTFADHISNFDLISNQFLNVARMLFHGVKNIDFRKVKKKVQENLLTVEKTVNTRSLLDEMLIKYDSLLKSRKYEIVSVVASFYVDFMMQEIFNDENEFIGYFILYALLFREDFELFRFTTFFESLYNNIDVLKDTLAQSEFNWENGYPNVSYITKTLRKIMIQSYAKIDRLMSSKEITQANQKTNMIEYTILKRMPDVFTKEMVKESHPDASKITIDRTFARLRDENKIRPNGTGRSATWTRVYKEEKFSEDQMMRQFTLADYVPEEDEDR